MKAKDTVMSKEKIIKFVTDFQFSGKTNRHVLVGEAVEDQAEITWKAREPEIEEARKAGYSEGFELGVSNLIASLNEGKEYGRKEVVECVHLGGTVSRDRKTLSISYPLWQATLKEWGIEEENNG